ncbi:MAG: hypothetical protein ACK57Y_00100 [Pirellulaceae bacterium]|jgi:hypothetical protein
MGWWRSFQRLSLAMQLSLIWLVGWIVTALVASVMQNTGGGNFADAGSSLHHLAMLGLLIGIVATWLVWRREQTEAMAGLQFHTEGSQMAVWPLTIDQCVVVLPEQSPHQTVDQVPLRNRRNIRAFLAAGATIDEPLLDTMQDFGRLEVLDLQNASIDPDLWDWVTHFRRLKTLLVSGALPPEKLSLLKSTLPEVRVIDQPTWLAIYATQPDPL